MSENRLIDVNKLSVCYINTGTVMFPKLEAFVRADDIADAPTVDAVEVVHGRWLHVVDAEYECNQCRKHVCFDEQIDGSIPAYKYCPNCGAKMDGDGNG